MLSNITYNAAACMQLSMRESLPKLAQKHSCTGLPVIAFVCVADVSIETIQHPIAAIENVAFFAINLLGALFHKKNCSSLDACVSLVGSVERLVLTPLLLVCSPVILFKCLQINLSNPKEPLFFNLRVEEEANFPLIAHDSKEFIALQKAIKANDLDTIKRLLTNDKLTNQRLADGLEKAIKADNLPIVELLLADPRLAKQSIGRELETAAKKNHSALTKLLLDKLIELNLNKTHSTIKKWQIEEASFKKYFSKAKDAATNKGHLELANHLNTFL